MDINTYILFFFVATILISIFFGIVASRNDKQAIKDERLLPGQPREGWGAIVQMCWEGKTINVQLGQIGPKHKMIIWDVDSARIRCFKIKVLKRSLAPK